MRQPKRMLVRLVFLAAAAAWAGSVAAAGLALTEQNASGLGYAYAGQAAVARDASTVFFNPAGMSFLSGPQVLVGATAIEPSIRFSNNGSSSIPALATATGSQPGGNGGNAGSWVFVPNFYATLPIGDRFTAGFGVSVPFGLKTEYDSTWIGRFQGINSELSTINYNAAAAFKVTDTISLGAGVNYQFLQTDLTNSIATPLGEGLTELKAQNSAWGWNVGALFQVSPDMRIGVSYRSSLNYTLEGTVNSTISANGAVFSPGTFNASANVKLPDMASLSVVQKFGDKWDMMSDITWTHWDVLQQVNIVDTANGATRQQLILNLQNAWRLSLGLGYHLSESWTLKGGFAWDQSPVQDQYRTVRLPDNSRYWFALGATYRPSKALAFDVGYAYLWIPSTTINSTQVQPGVPAALGTSVVSGDYQNSANILALQVSYTF
ncbi:MAG TPA: outer membrane protein transport protein [Burkholderiales bacterium]|nr:outer membrane protein transport protein [Burkholderiales bacterium]